MDNHRTLALLEFPDEADAYLRNRRAGAYGDGEPVVISLNPRVRAYLTQRGLSSEDTPGYFGPEAHARCLRRSADACAWIRERFRFVDDRGLETSYRDSVVWYCRQIVHYCLWGGELLTEAVERRRPSLIVSGAPIVRDLHGHLMHDGERYLGLLAQRLGEARRIPVTMLPRPGGRRADHRADPSPPARRPERALRGPVHERELPDGRGGAPDHSTAAGRPRLAGP